MPAISEVVRVYRELAEVYESQKQVQMRDRFLVLAADAALTAGRPEEAERLRSRLLELNPHHLLKPYASLEEALRTLDVRTYMNALRRSHPYERAEHLLETMTQEREATPKPAATASVPHDEAAELLQVFRVQETDANRAAPTRSPAVATKNAQPQANSARNATTPVIYPLIREQTSPSNRASLNAAAGESAEARWPSWLTLGLFAFVVLLFLSLAAYTVVKPFLQ